MILIILLSTRLPEISKVAPNCFDHQKLTNLIMIKMSFATGFRLFLLLSISIIIICEAVPVDISDVTSSLCEVPLSNRLKIGHDHCVELIKILNRTRYRLEKSHSFLHDIDLSLFEPTDNKFVQFKLERRLNSQDMEELLHQHGHTLISYEHHMRHQLLPNFKSDSTNQKEFDYFFRVCSRHAYLVSKLDCSFSKLSSESKYIQHLSSQLSLLLKSSMNLASPYSSPSECLAVLARYVFLRNIYSSLTRLSLAYQLALENVRETSEHQRLK